jgi:hypothetical protein
MTDQNAAEGPQERPEGDSAALESPEGQNGPQTGTEGFGVHNAGPSVRECAEADRAYWTDKHAGEN